MISRQRTAGSVSVPGIPGGWYPSVRGSPRSAARGQPRRRRPLPRPGGPRRRGGGALPPRRAAHGPQPDITGPHSSTPLRHRIHPRPSPPRPASACGPAARDGSARARCPAGTRHHRANCSCHRVEQHLTARASAVFVLRPVRRPPLLRSDLRRPACRWPPPGAHTTTSSHPPRAPPAGLPPPNRLLLATRPDGVPQYPRGTPARRYRCTANERCGCPVAAAAVDERADSSRLPPRWPRHTPAAPADGNSGPDDRAY